MAPSRKSSGRKSSDSKNAAGQRRWTPFLEEHAVNTMRQRLAPSISDRALMRQYVRAAALDVDMALDWWQTDRDRAEGGDEAALSPRVAEPNGRCHEAEIDEDMDRQAGEDAESDVDDEASDEDADEGREKLFGMMQSNRIASCFGPNTEQERRDAALRFRLGVEEASMGVVVLSPAQAIFFLHLCAWDLGDALTQWSSTTVRANFTRLGQFDPLREPLPRQIKVDDVTRTRGQDERIATFVNITGRPDWYSMRERLVEADYNLIEAVLAWFRRGVRPEKPYYAHPLEGRGIRVDLHEQELTWPEYADCDAAASLPLTEEGWGAEPDLFMPDDHAALSVDGPPVENDKNSRPEKGGKKVERERHEGFLLHIDLPHVRDTAQVGVVNPQLFLIEWISRGRYWFNRFRHHGYRWPGLQRKPQRMSDPQAALPIFDWHNQTDINRLNNWRRQSLIRATGYNTREGSQHWSEEEIAFLVDLTEELYQDTKRRFPDKGDDEILPLRVTNHQKTEWTRRFNEKFTGTVQPGSNKPRIDRKTSALMTQRIRVRVLIDRYKVSADKNWFAKETKKRKRSDRSPSEEEYHTGLTDPSGAADTEPATLTTGATDEKEDQNDEGDFSDDHVGGDSDEA